MPELDLMIGGRSYRVSCASGEEDALLGAAEQLDGEAQKVLGGGGAVVPENRLLLLAGLMLADRIREAEHVAELAAQALERQEDAGQGAGDLARLEAVACALEEMADTLEAQLGA